MRGRAERGRAPSLGDEKVDWKFAAKSSVACWPTPQNSHDSGNHVVYRAQLPPNSVMNIKLWPDSSLMDLNLYAYTVGKMDYRSIPPKINGVVSCEAHHGSKSIKMPYKPGKPESVQLNATKNGYNVFIVVAGAQGITKGAFKLELSLKSKAAEPTGKVKKVSTFKIARGKVIKLKGKLDGGPQIALSWAAKSSVACWPTPQNKFFNGAYVVFSTELPSDSEMTIKMIPSKKALDLSLYAYQVGTSDKKSVPPNVASVVTCNTSYKTRNDKKPHNPGATESVRLNAIRNPYKV